MAREDRKVGSIIDIAFGATGIADIEAPTIAEIVALTRIECFLVGDSMATPRDGNTTDIAALCDRESHEIAADITNGPIMGTFWHEFNGTNAAWTAFADTAFPAVTQHLVVCRGGFSGVAGIPAATDEVDTYVVQVVARGHVIGTKSDGQRFDAKLANVDRFYDGVVAA